MTSLTPAKIERLRTLLRTLPGPVADRLTLAAGEGDPLLARLLSFCRLDPEEAARTRFFAPLAPLSGDPADTRPSLAYAPPAVLEALWRWIDETLDREAAETARRAAARFETSESGELDCLRVRVAERILAELDRLDEDPKAEKRLRQFLGVRDFKAVRDIAVILRAAPVLRRALDGLPSAIEEISDAVSADLRDRYERAAEEDPDAGAWFLYFVMARLTKPWRILRTFERIGKRGDDLLLSRTDMAGIGDALLLDAEHHLSGFEKSPASPAEARAAAAALAEFATVTVGMTREIGIRKDGAWGQKLVALRTRAAAQMERIHARARKVFDPVLAPPRAGRAARLNPVPASGMAEFEEAVALALFLKATAADASRAAVGGAHQELLNDLKTELDELGGHLLRQLRDEDGEHAEAARTRLEDVARLLTALGETDSANILLRRTAAAKAA
ncbi:hypothetical protein E5163_02240 [Marinicauda algicola]|uniref:Uncharacterized protein n=1 Tax=Marinicauda algicola TaxID=2029849 RepID=A0A4S2H343_9PROT|nr:hypothetical protein [Marinicauda algicola]TGY89974.1 hypothetical protein E5163_02240 [Marinicauda algicola]